MEKSLFILDICDPNNGWQTSLIIVNNEVGLEAMDKAISEAKSKGHTVSTTYIHGADVAELQKYLVKEADVNNNLDSPPLGEYGVFCEARGHMGNPGWLNHKPSTYEEAVKLADLMCRSNKMWHYYAKPIK